jgi:hypothetical protein
MFKKRRAKYKDITSVSQIKSHLREFILDTQLPEPEELAEHFGIPPISDELMEREEQESGKRLDHIGYLTPLVYGYASIYVEAFIAQAFSDKILNPENESPKASKLINQRMKSTLEDAMTNLLMGAFAQVVDLGLLNKPKGNK